MKIRDFKVGESFSYVEFMKGTPGEEPTGHVMIGKLEKIIDAGMFDYSGANIYHFPNDHTFLEIGNLGDSSGYNDGFTKDVELAKRTFLQLLFMPNNRFEFRGR